MAYARESQARFDAAREEIAHLRQGIAAYHGDYEFWQSEVPHGYVNQTIEDWRERDRCRAEGRQMEIKTEVSR